ncbi:GYP1 [Hepatospora eriocheir]|uniref:GYP1 n=1 Tax=Hepatospora eriocheir TaxID=1081669 RepID=A0A1X0QAH4_9MICR|nr:GYP1 [Hepatospora eriocheir]
MDSEELRKKLRTKKFTLFDRKTTYKQLLIPNFNDTKLKEEFKYLNKLINNLDKEINKQIDIDIKRLPIESRFINDKNIEFIYNQILGMVVCVFPKVSYVQGMTDILVPFVKLYLNQSSSHTKGIIIKEEDIINVFCCYKNLISKLRNNLYLIQSNLAKLTNKWLLLTDPILYNHLKSHNIDIHLLTIRWYSCLFTREFQGDKWYLIFDYLLTYSDINDGIISVAVSLLTILKRKIVRLDFYKTLIYVQNYKYENLSIKTVIEGAYETWESYNNEKKKIRRNK